MTRYSPRSAGGGKYSPTWTGYGRAGEPGKFFLTAPWNREPATSGNGTMLAFLAESREAVDAFHAAALAAGGADEGAPGVRAGMNPVFYAAYVRDPEEREALRIRPAVNENPPPPKRGRIHSISYQRR